MDRVAAHAGRERLRWQLRPIDGPVELQERRAAVRAAAVDLLDVRATAYALIDPYDDDEHQLVLIESASPRALDRWLSTRGRGQ